MTRCCNVQAVAAHDRHTHIQFSAAENAENEDDGATEDQGEDHGDGRPPACRDVFVGFSDACVVEVDDVHWKETLREEPVEESRTDDERNGVAIRQLEVVTRPLLAFRFRYAEGFPLRCEVVVLGRHRHRCQYEVEGNVHHGEEELRTVRDQRCPHRRGCDFHYGADVNGTKALVPEGLQV